MVSDISSFPPLTEFCGVNEDLIVGSHIGSVFTSARLHFTFAIFLNLGDQGKILRLLGSLEDFLMHCNMQNPNHIPFILIYILVL